MNRGTTAVLLLGVAAAMAYQYNARSRVDSAADEEGAETVPSARRVVVRTDDFTCEGKTRCTEMTSCAEARFYLAHCPGVKIDGDHDGVPCESQWCDAE